MKAELEALTGFNGITRASPAGKVRPKPEVRTLAAGRKSGAVPEVAALGRHHIPALFG